MLPSQGEMAGQGADPLPAGYTAGLGTCRQPQQNSGCKQPEDRTALQRGNPRAEGGKGGEGRLEGRGQGSGEGKGASSHGAGHLVTEAVCTGLADGVPMKGQKPRGWVGRKRAWIGSLEGAPGIAGPPKGAERGWETVLRLPSRLTLRHGLTTVRRDQAFAVCPGKKGGKRF